MASFKQAGADFRRSARMMRDAANRANKRAATAILKELQYYSGGQFSTATLRWMGHPYALRGVAAGLTMPYGDPGVINRQTGIFQASWRITVIPVSGLIGGVGYRISNIASYAEYLEHGTSTMIARPILHFAQEWIVRNYPTILGQELDKLDLPVFTRK